MGCPPPLDTVSSEQVHSSSTCPCASIRQVDSLRLSEDHPPPPSVHIFAYFHAHSGVAVGFFAPCARPRCRGPSPVSEICSRPNFRIRRNHIWVLIMRQKRRSLKRCGQDSGVSIGRPGCPMPPSGRCMTSIGRYSNRRGEDLSPSYAGLGPRYL